MRLIDADALKDALGIWREWENALYVDMIIDQAPTIGGWISVEDRLPNDKKLVYLWFMQGSKWKSPIPFVGRYDPVGYGGWRIYGVDDDLLDIFQVTHWMPMPELPEES